jgi:hypothetical protein
MSFYTRSLVSRSVEVAMETLVHTYMGSKMGLTKIKSVYVFIQNAVIRNTVKT